MKKFSDIISRSNWAILAATFLPIYVILLGPTIKELVVLVTVDQLMTPLAFLAERLIIRRRDPKSELFYPEFRMEEIRRLDLDGKKALFRALSNFPGLRARNTFLINYLKSFVTAAVAVYYWHHSISNVAQGILFYGIVSIVYTYFYSVVFIDNHEFVSRKIAEIHREFDWSDVFRECQLPYSRRDFEFQESLAMFSIAALMLATQFAVLSSHARESAAVPVIAIGAAGLILIWRVWYLGRRFFVGGLLEIFAVFEDFDPERNNKTLALHSSPILARFESVFNALSNRLRLYEQELSQWIFIKTEESRYRALGEVSGLIVHDLAAPLHVIHFCTEQLQEDPSRIRDPRYLNNLALNGVRAQELIGSLKAYLKNSADMEIQVCVQDALGDALRLIETQFYPLGFASIKIRTDQDFQKTLVALTKADLIHVFMNLLSNSIKNLLDNKITHPEIEIGVAEETEQDFFLFFRDNGTGLESERFEQLTAFAFQGLKSSSREGLGLRLVRRLLERVGGGLQILPSHSSGTSFRIRLPRRERVQEELND